MSKNALTEDIWRTAFETCKANNDDKVIKRRLKMLFPTRTLGSITMIVNRYNTLHDSTSGWGDNIPKKAKKVWAEKNWRRNGLDLIHNIY